MNSKVKLIAIILIVLIVLGVIWGYFKSQNDNSIPDNYIAVFNGGFGEITYSTYVYKIDNGQANYGFRYINTTSKTVSWGSTKWSVKVTGEGEVPWTDNIFAIAKDNNAYSYVRLPNDNKIYSVDEFMAMFLMN